MAEGIAEQYPSLGFVEDTNDGLRQQLGIADGGGGGGGGGGGFFGGGGRNKRTTYVLSASGVVAEIISDRTGATEHAVQALRALKELEAAEAAAAAAEAAVNVPSGEALRQLFVDSSGEETAEALKVQAAERAAASSAALREQAMFAKANWKAKFGSGFATSGSRDGKALAKEAALAGQVAAERLAKAMAAGDTDAAVAARVDVRLSLRIQVDALEADLRFAEQEATRAEKAAKEGSDKAGRARLKAQQAASALAEVQEKRRLQTRLFQWQEQQEAAEAQANADRASLDALLQGGPEAAAEAAAASAAAAAPAAAGEWSFSLFEPQATAWRVPYDTAIDKLTASLQAAKASNDLAQVAASQAELTETWAALGTAKAAAKEAEVLVDQVKAAEQRIPPLVEAAVQQEAIAAAAASKAAAPRP